MAESIPIAALGRFKVISINYRQGPEKVFPAASEDVAAVYQDVLKTYRPENIGIYGCSAGGALTAEVEAWFQDKKIPSPGAYPKVLAGFPPTLVITGTRAPDLSAAVYTHTELVRAGAARH